MIQFISVAASSPVPLGLLVLICFAGTVMVIVPAVAIGVILVRDQRNKQQQAIEHCQRFILMDAQFIAYQPAPLGDCRPEDVPEYDKITRHLRELGFEPIGDYRHPLFRDVPYITRVMASRDRATTASFQKTAATQDPLNDPQRTTISYAFATELDNGFFVDTSNNKSTVPGLSIPHVHRQRFESGTPLEELLAAHLKLVNQLIQQHGCHPVPVHNHEEFLATSERVWRLQSASHFHKRLCEAVTADTIARLSLNTEDQRVCNAAQDHADRVYRILQHAYTPAPNQQAAQGDYSPGM